MQRMKDSGIEWIGEIPESWEVVRLKTIFSFGKGLPITKENLVEHGIPVISYGQIHSKTNTGVAIQKDSIRYVPDVYLQSGRASLVHQNDFIFADTSEDLDGCGNCVFVDKETTLFAGYHTIIFRSNKNQCNKYLAYLFKTDEWRKQIRARVSGVKVFSISRRILSDATVIIPTMSEQDCITSYLDTQCAKIDAVLEQTRNSIEEYKKLKQSVITQAVTKGIRPGRKMKDSGIEWIGEIPEEYCVVRLKNILKTQLQYGANESGVAFDKSLPRYIRITDITLDGKLKETGALSLPEAESEGYILFDNDVLFARSGATVGKAFIYKKEYGRASFAGYLIRAVLDQQYSPDLLFLYTQSSIYEEWKKQIFIQSTIQNIGADRYRELPIILQPNNEQNEIVSYLIGKCDSIDALISKKQLFLTTLEAYKKSLIYECVTGKKEV